MLCLIQNALYLLGLRPFLKIINVDELILITIASISFKPIITEYGIIVFNTLSYITQNYIF